MYLAIYVQPYYIHGLIYFIQHFYIFSSTMAITSSKSGTISITRTAIVLTLVSIISVTQAEGKKLIYYKHRHQVNTESLGLPREWHSWKSEHGKSYLTQKEELERHVVWQANKKFIETHNVFNETFGYTLGMNEFGDMVCAKLMDRGS